MNKTDLLLVNPGNKKAVYGKLGESLSGVEPPVWTGLLASFIRDKGFKVVIIDAEAEGLSSQEVAERVVACNPTLVGVGTLGANPSAASTPKMAAASEVLKALKLKQLKAKTIAYGIHVSALPEKTLRENTVDFVCRGETFYPFFELLKTLKADQGREDFLIKGLWYLKDNQVVDNGWANLVKDLDEFGFIAWDLLPMDRYRAHNWHCFGHINQRSPYVVIYTSLGCPFDCKYCNIRALYNGQPGIRYRSVSKVVEEIDFLVKKYAVKNFKILDELFVLDKKRANEFCDLLIERNYGLNIWAYARIDTVGEAVLNKLKQAGVNWLAYGIEAASRKVRDGVSKGKFDQTGIERVVKMTKSCGINIIGNFMFGLPDDDSESMQETLDLAKKLNCEYINFYTTMAYPGSVLYQESSERGVKLSSNWLEYSQFSRETTPLATKHLSAKEVLKFRDRAFDEYYKNPEYLKMIEEKFGQSTVEHIKQMRKHKLNRKLLEEPLECSQIS